MFTSDVKKFTGMLKDIYILTDRGSKLNDLR